MVDEERVVAGAPGTSSTCEPDAEAAASVVKETSGTVNVRVPYETAVADTPPVAVPVTGAILTLPGTPVTIPGFSLTYPAQIPTKYPIPAETSSSDPAHD